MKKLSAFLKYLLDVFFGSQPLIVMYIRVFFILTAFNIVIDIVFYQSLSTTPCWTGGLVQGLIATFVLTKRYFH